MLRIMKSFGTAIDVCQLSLENSTWILENVSVINVLFRFGETFHDNPTDVASVWIALRL